MNCFISGGCKNGKSHYAQRLAKSMSEEKDCQLYYIATMAPGDEEDRARIRLHLSDRKGWGFYTLEQPFDLCGCLSRADSSGVFLLDSVTALLDNEMFRRGHTDHAAPERLSSELARFAEATGNTVFVSDYIYSDAVIYERDLTEEYRKGLALADRTLAGLCDRVIEIAYGREFVYK